MNDDPPIILTAMLDDESFTFFDNLRHQHFPAERNFLRAHLTLFHHLPNKKGDEAATLINLLCRDTNSIELVFEKWRSLGRGVAMKVISPKLVSIRRLIADHFFADLTPQDKNKFDPHITVQNKVSPDEASALLAALSSKHQPWAGRATGIAMWHYLGGPWQLVSEHRFVDES